MKDLNMLRSEFEAYEHSKKPCAIRERLFEVFTKDGLDEDEYLYIGKYVDSFMQEKWELWQQAKALVLPYDYFLVPKDIPDRVVSCLENSRFHWGDRTRDYYAPIYSLMVEVASESGDEG